MRTEFWAEQILFKWRKEENMSVKKGRPKEIWRKVFGYGGIYSISNFDRVRIDIVTHPTQGKPRIIMPSHTPND